MIQKETTGMILRKLRGDRTQEEIAAILNSTWNAKAHITGTSMIMGGYCVCGGCIMLSFSEVRNV